MHIKCFFWGGEFFLIQIQGLRLEGVYCKAPCSKLRFVILGFIDTTDLTLKGQRPQFELWHRRYVVYSLSTKTMIFP